MGTFGLNAKGKTALGPEEQAVKKKLALALQERFKKFKKQ
jgi:hypothetical protein